MSYVSETLLPGEKLVWMGKVHWIVMMTGLITLGLAAYLTFSLYQGVVGFVLGIFGAISFAKGVIYYFTTELAITDRRVIAKFGFISRVTFELNLNRVTSLTVDQPILGRLLNYGSISVIGMGGSYAPIHNIIDPLKFRRLVLGEVEIRDTPIP